MYMYMYIHIYTSGKPRNPLALPLCSTLTCPYVCWRV